MLPLSLFAGARIPHNASAPFVFDENATFTDEGTATTGWTAVNGTMASASSYLRLTKTTGGSVASMTKSVTFPTTNKDYTLYGQMRCSRGTNHIGVIWFLSGDLNVALWFGTAEANTSHTDQKLSLIGTTNSGLTRNVAPVAALYDYEATAIEFAIEYDNKFGSLNLSFKEGGLWKLKARVLCEYVSAATIQVLLASPAPGGSWIEFDYLMLCRPNHQSIGDSIPEGKTLFSPNLSLILTDVTSYWQTYAAVYTSMRNTLINNKGVGGNTSAQILSRLSADVLSHSPRLVYLHASTNDYLGGGTPISLADRTANIQACIDAINAAGARCVLINAMYGTSTNSENPGLRDYMLDWWNNYRPSLTGEYATADIMQPLLSGGYMADALTQSDKIHPTPAGYALIGPYIAASLP